MNNKRRKEIKNIYSQFEVLKNKLEIILFDEQDYYDNMPENLQCSMRASDSEEAIEILGDQVSYLNDIINDLKKI